MLFIAVQHKEPRKEQVFATVASVYGEENAAIIAKVYEP
jgi:hypothetical protein